MFEQEFNWETGDELGLYPFEVKVAVIKNRPPRHKAFKWGMGFGESFIAMLFDENTPDDIKGDIMFVFPERWLAVYEQRELMSRLKECKGITSLRMITSSPILVGEFTADMIRIFTYPDDKR